jgi:hypothetical protein
MESAKCGSQRNGQFQKASELHWTVDESIEGLASAVLDYQHHPPALAHEGHWLQSPRTVDVISQLVFVSEASDALGSRLLGADSKGYESVLSALGAIVR